MNADCKKFTTRFYIKIIICVMCYTAGKQGILTMFVAVKSFKLKTHLCTAIELGIYLIIISIFRIYLNSIK